MTIGIDARMMDSTFGLGRYIQQLVKHLVTHGGTHTYVLFFRSKEQRARNTEQLGPLPPNMRTVFADIPWYGWKEQLLFPRLIKKERVDVMHFPHWNVPLLYRGRFLVTIHDLTMFRFPRPEATTLGPLLFWFKDRVSRMVIRHAARRASHIITTTEFTKMDVHMYLGVKKEKMTTTYQAPFTKVIKEHEPSRTDTEHHATPYVLYVGAAYPHKNLSGLLRAWKTYVETHGSGHTLLLAGRKDYFYDRLCDSALFKETPRVQYLGEVSDAMLHELYQSASLYVFPSLYEGFGLPPLEAMMYGVPVVSSDRSCLPEILGEAAVYVDPENPEQFAASMHRVLTDQDLQYQLKEQGRGQLKLYSWDRLAQQTRRFYETYL